MKTHSFQSQKSVGISWFWPYHLFYLLQTEKYIYLYILFHFSLKIVQDSNDFLVQWSYQSLQPSHLKSSLSLLPRVVTHCHHHQQQYVLIHDLAWSSQILIFQNDLIYLLFVYYPKHYLYLLEWEQTESLFLYVHIPLIMM